MARWMERKLERNWAVATFTLLISFFAFYGWIQWQDHQTLQVAVDELEQSEIQAGERREILLYMDCILGGYLLFEFADRDPRTIVEACGMSEQRLERIERIFEEAE